MYKTVHLYGNMNDVTIKEIVEELAQSGIQAKVKGPDRLLITMSDVTHEQAFTCGAITENIISYQYYETVTSAYSEEIESLKKQIKELTRQIDKDKEFSIPFKVEQLEDIVY